MDLNEDVRQQTNMAGYSAGTKPARRSAASDTTVRVVIANATGMGAYPIIDLAEEHDVALVLDHRRDRDRDISTLEWLLGPCYAHLPGDPRVSSLYIGKMTNATNTWRGQSSVLVLTDADRAEPLAALARAACEPYVTVELVRKTANSARREQL